MSAAWKSLARPASRTRRLSGASLEPQSASSSTSTASTRSRWLDVATTYASPTEALSGVVAISTFTGAAVTAGWSGRGLGSPALRFSAPLKRLSMKASSRSMSMSP